MRMSRRHFAHLTAVALILFSVADALAQPSIASAQHLAFEVASVKRNTTNGPVDSVPRRSGTLVMMHNTQPHMMIYYAYRLNGGFQLTGNTSLPNDWNWYDIDARTQNDVKDDQIRLMFQTLLEDRFRLKAHWETKEITGYELLVGAGRPKLKISGSKDPITVTIEGTRVTQNAGRCSTSAWGNNGNHMLCHSAPVEAIRAELQSLLRAPVIDRTGRTESYDCGVNFILDNAKASNDNPIPTLAAALQLELGLKLVKSKVQAEVLVVDNLEKPSEN